MRPLDPPPAASGSQFPAFAQNCVGLKPTVPQIRPSRSPRREKQRQWLFAGRGVALFERGLGEADEAAVRCRHGLALCGGFHGAREGRHALRISDRELPSSILFSNVNLEPSGTSTVVSTSPKSMFLPLRAAAMILDRLLFESASSTMVAVMRQVGGLPCSGDLCERRRLQIHE
jgi:hypothetical protein